MNWRAPGKWTRIKDLRGQTGRLSAARSLMVHPTGATLALYHGTIDDEGIAEGWWWELQTVDGTRQITQVSPWAAAAPFPWADAILASR